MTEVVFRPLDALKLSIEPKKMQPFVLPSSESNEEDTTESNESNNDEEPLSSSHKYLQNVVINMTENNKTYDRNLILDRLKKNNMLMTYCNAEMTPANNSPSIDLEVRETPQSVQSFVDESSDRETKSQEALEEKADTLIKTIDPSLSVDKSRKTQKRIQIQPEKTADIPSKPIQPIDLPDQGEFELDKTLALKYDNDNKPTLFVVCPFGTKEARPGKASGEQLAPERKREDFSDLEKIPDWRSQLCNDYNKPFQLEGHTWTHVDHYMVYAQYKNHPEAGSLKTFTNIESFVKNKKNKPDPDFEQRKRTEMYHALYAKFSQHTDLVKTLYLTQNAKLVRRINKQKKEDFLELMWLRETLKEYGHYVFESAKLQEGFMVPPVEAAVAAKKKGKKDEKSPDLRKVSIGSIEAKLPPSEKRIVKASSYYMNNRAQFVKRINELFAAYRSEVAHDSDGSGDSSDPEKFSLLTHQKVVRDYINLYSPYRGVLLFHGLGAGKTGSSIAIAEGMKGNARKIYIMTPASLRANFFEELQKFGDDLYKKKQYWEFVSVDGKPDLIPKLSKALTLSTKYIQQKKGAWMVDVRQPSNYDNLSPDNKVSLQDQIQQMIARKYEGIHYNAPNLKTIIQNLERHGKSKNPFDHSVVIVDEAHNLVSRIVGKLKHKKLQSSIYYELYHMLMGAENCRLVMLSGTPIINSPHELAVMFNMIRGYISTWSLPLERKTSERITQEYLMKLFDSNGLKTFDYVHISRDNILTITRNPFGFVNTSSKGPVHIKKKQTQKININPPKTGKHNKTQKKQEGGDTKFKFEEMVGGGEYDGVRLDRTGNIDNETFLNRVVKILSENGLPLKPGAKPKLTQEKCLEDNDEKFRETFLKDVTNIAGKKAEESDLLHVNTLRNRIMGLTSYFRSAKEELLPSFVLNENQEPYHEVIVEMSDHQFTEYAKYRKEERDQEDKNKKAQRAMRAQVNSEELFEASSTFRIFSRAACNFTFPNPPQRPRPTKKKADVDGDKDRDGDGGVDGTDNNKNTEVELDEKSIEGTPIPNEVEDDDAPERIDDAYQKRIQAALDYLEKNASTLLSREGLKTYSPKFLEILNRIQNPNNYGCHLLYSNFRTLEGIGILKLILEANGMREFRIHRSDGKWIMEDIPDEEIEKPSFVLYTGTEDEEQKEIMRHIYNGTWEQVDQGSWKTDPRELIHKIRAKYQNNHYGGVIKLFMITSAGAEGINLRNTRFVHVVEPYWHNVRLEQVVGRARRIKSHIDLPQEMRNVEVFVYMSTLSENQRKDDRYKELLLNDVGKENQERTVTTDEHLYEIAQIKQKVNKQFLRLLKETAMDCHLYVSKHKKQEPLVCYNNPKIMTNEFSSYPTLQQDIDDEPV